MWAEPLKWWLGGTESQLVHNSILLDVNSEGGAVIAGREFFGFFDGFKSVNVGPFAASAISNRKYVQLELSRLMRRWGDASIAILVDGWGWGGLVAGIHICIV